MNLVVGTAGHVDHGKTALLLALTGIDADRLPDEKRRGMTIDVGYAFLDIGNGRGVDFVDVPGHEDLVGNMLVGVGEIDTALLVVACDEGPRKQTHEHLRLLQAAHINPGFIVVTKTDRLTGGRLGRALLNEQIDGLVAGTEWSSVPRVWTSALSGVGLDALKRALAQLFRSLLPDDVVLNRIRRPTRAVVDRVFRVQGRGIVLTATLVCGRIAEGDLVRVEPNGRSVRVREVQVHSRRVGGVEGGGRIALLVTGDGTRGLRRGAVVTSSAAVRSCQRILVGVSSARGAGTPRERAEVQLHIGTARVGARVQHALAGSRPIEGHGQLTAAVLHLAEPIAAAVGDRAVLRWPEAHTEAAAIVVLDTACPPRRVLRDRNEPLAALLVGRSPVEQFDAWIAFRGAVTREEASAVWTEFGGGTTFPETLPLVEYVGALVVSRELLRALETSAIASVAEDGRPTASVVSELVSIVRHRAAVPEARARDTATELIRRLDRRGLIALVHHELYPAAAAQRSERTHRLIEMLSTYAPPRTSVALNKTGCSRGELRQLLRAGEIVRLSDEIAYAAGTFGELTRIALKMAADAPLTPAAFRDKIGTTRRHVLPILEALNRRGVLRRTDGGHVVTRAADEAERTRQRLA